MQISLPYDQDQQVSIKFLGAMRGLEHGNIRAQSGFRTLVKVLAEAAVTHLI